jgi:hypothetical protein
MDDRLEEIDRLSARLGELAGDLRSAYRTADQVEIVHRIRGTAWALYWAATPPPVSPGAPGPTSGSKTMTCPRCTGTVTVTLS